VTSHLFKLYEERDVMLTSRKDKRHIQEIKEKFGEVRMTNNDETSSSDISAEGWSFENVLEFTSTFCKWNETF
jgi:hypothetical protein